MMATGTVKWFNPTKGYGFIQPQDGSRDVFVHISAVERAGLSSLNEGQTIEYEIVSNRGKQSAENIKTATGHSRHLDRAQKRQQHDRKTFAGIRSRQQCRSSAQGPQKEAATRGRFS